MINYKEQEWNHEQQYVKRQKKTYIIQLVKKRPEMPEEVELGNERRKQHAELTMEYPAKKKKTNTTQIRTNERKETQQMPTLMGGI